MHVDVLVKNAIIVTLNHNREIIKDGAMAIKDGIIIQIGPTSDVLPCITYADKIIEASGKAVFPGLINTHNHLFQTLLKGLGDDMMLKDWFATMTAPAAIHLTEKDVEMATYLGCIDSLRSGCTTMFDYMYPHARKGLSEAILDTFLKLDMRCVYGRGMMTTGTQFGVPSEIIQKPGQIVEDFKMLYKNYGGKGNINNIWLAPAAAWSNTMEMFSEIKKLMQEYDTGLSIHIAETPFDIKAAEELHGCNEIEVLQKMDLLGPNTLFVHCVHLTKRDIRMIQSLGVCVSHNPVSNMYLSSGVAPIPDLVERGVAVGLATDGAASNNTNDMIEVLKSASLLQKVVSMDPTIITAERVLEMATIDGSKALGLDNIVGSLEVNKRADFFIFNPLKSARSTPMHNPVSALVYTGSPINVETVAVNGKLVIEDSAFVEIDESKIIAQASEQAFDLIYRASIKSGIDRPWKNLAY